jgi:hypothetical protein
MESSALSRPNTAHHARASSHVACMGLLGDMVMSWLRGDAKQTSVERIDTQNRTALHFILLSCLNMSAPNA